MGVFLRFKRVAIHYHVYMDNRLKQIFTLVTTFLGILLPLPWALSGFQPWGVEAFELESLITPAPYAFVIWLPIYLGLLGLAVYQMRSDQLDNPRAVALRPWLALTAVLNAMWLSNAFNQDLWLTVLAGFAMLVAALFLRHSLGIGETYSGVLRPLAASTSLLIGWLTVASTVALATALLNSGWTGGMTFWAVLILIVLGLVGLVMQRGWRDAAYGAVFLWAFIAIAVEQWVGGHALVVVVCMILAVVFALSLIPRKFRG